MKTVFTSKGTTQPGNSINDEMKKKCDVAIHEIFTEIIIIN